jgi:hypothetical protein
VYYESDLVRALMLVLALFWGIFWACFLQFVPVGRFLAVRRTWLTVVIGVGVDLGLMKPVLPWELWLMVAGIVALSAVGIIVRSLCNEHRETEDELDAVAGE